MECDCGMSSKNGTVVESANEGSSMTGEKVMGDSGCASVNGESVWWYEASIEQPSVRNKRLVESLQEKFSYAQCQGPGYSAEERANELFNMVFANSILGVKQLFII